MHHIQLMIRSHAVHGKHVYLLQQAYMRATMHNIDPRRILQYDLSHIAANTAL
jgi:hypothetical protein